MLGYSEKRSAAPGARAADQRWSLHLIVALKAREGEFHTAVPLFAEIAA